MIWEAPGVYALTAVLLIGGTWYFCSQYYSKNLAMKDDIIASLEKKLSFVVVPTSEEIKRAMLPNGGYPVVLFNRLDEFARAYDFRKAFDVGNKISALWMSGGGVLETFGEDVIIRQGAVRKLLLVDPTTKDFQLLVSTLGETEDYRTYRQQILRMTRLAQDELSGKAEVKWTKKFLNLEVTLVSPQQGTPWAHFEITLPHSRVYRRPYGRVEGIDAKALFDQLADWYDKIWNDPNVSYSPKL